MTAKDGEVTTLIESQRYDKYGNLIYRKMGNGAETSYTYDDKRLHLNQMSLTSNGTQLMANKHTYDNVDNILGIANAAKPASGDIGGESSHIYEYDAINRLISAQGSAKDNNAYELSMRYDVMSNPLQKDTISYEYETYNHPNAVSRAGSKIFKYDANGNPISIEDTTTNALRVMQWDEENRLQSLGDDGYVSRYTYNHTGERVVKSHGGTTVAYVNGAPQGVIWDDQDNWTAYVSPYMVVNGDRFTKHYYVGSQRIASKIGVGEFNNLYDASKSCVTAGQKDYAERVSLITQSRDDYNAALGIAPGPPTAKGIYGEAEYSGAYGSYSIKPLGNYDVPTGWPSKPYKRPYGGTPGAPVMYQKPSDPDDTGAGYGYSNAEGLSESDVYFYHSDHLGSTSYITDKDGNAVQYIAYKPFGETLIDEHAVSYDSPWKFNGKEWDSETGLYYYGARYYEPGLSLWYGVDALAEKYPAVGGYVYCAANPVKFVDVDGKEVKPCSNEALLIIKSTLPKDARQFVILNSNGFIDAKFMRLYKGESSNFKSLLTLVESHIQITVTTLNEIEFIYDGTLGTESFNKVEIFEDYVDDNFKRSQGNTTGECGNCGVTYMPTHGTKGKADADNPESIHININPSLSIIGAAETFSHEGYGHALIYVETGGDRDRAIHHYDNLAKDKELTDKSIAARKETVKNIIQ